MDPLWDDFGFTNQDSRCNDVNNHLQPRTHWRISYSATEDILEVKGVLKVLYWCKVKTKKKKSKGVVVTQSQLIYKENTANGKKTLGEETNASPNTSVTVRTGKRWISSGRGNTAFASCIANLFVTFLLAPYLLYQQKPESVWPMLQGTQGVSQMWSSTTFLLIPMVPVHANKKEICAIVSMEMLLQFWPRRPSLSLHQPHQNKCQFSLGPARQHIKLKSYNKTKPGTLGDHPPTLSPP